MSTTIRPSRPQVRRVIHVEPDLDADRVVGPGSAATVGDPPDASLDAAAASSSVAEDEAKDESAPARREGRPRRWPVVLLALVAAGGIAGTAGFGRAWATAQAGSRATAAVAGTSRNFVIALTNFDPGTVSADFSQIQSYACCQFSGQASKFFGSTIRSELTKAHAASRGKISDLYVQSVSGSSASVFAVVDQTYLNSYAHSPIADTLRLVLGLTEVKGTWKVSSVQVLQQPVSATEGSSSTSSGATSNKK
jgi:hypothetical protein